MSQRSLNQPIKASTKGLAIVNFSFVLQGTGAIDLTESAAGTTLRGEGLLPGGSVVYQSSTGVYLITLGIGYTFRYIVSWTAEIQDASTSDGARAVLGAFTNEGTDSQITIVLNTMNKSGTLANLTARRCCVTLFMKDTGATA